MYSHRLADDRSKEKQGRNEGEKNVISIVKLAEIIKETMQVFWEFLRADKREANLGLKGVQGTQMDTAETELFMNIKSDLQKVCLSSLLIEVFLLVSKLYYA